MATNSERLTCLCGRTYRVEVNYDYWRHVNHCLKPPSTRWWKKRVTTTTP